MDIFCLSFLFGIIIGIWLGRKCKQLEEGNLLKDSDDEKRKMP